MRAAYEIPLGHQKVVYQAHAGVHKLPIDIADEYQIQEAKESIHIDYRLWFLLNFNSQPRNLFPDHLLKPYHAALLVCAWLFFFDRHQKHRGESVKRLRFKIPA